MGLVIAREDATTVVGCVVDLLQDLTDAPVGTLRGIAQISVEHAVQLTEALLQLAPSDESADWLRCLLTELHFITGRPADSIAVAAAVSADGAPPSVAGSVAVAEVLSSALLHPDAAEAAARRRLRAARGGIAHDPAAIASTSVLADCRARAGDMEEALYWSRRAAAHADLLPSPFWSMHLLAEAASRMADAGEDAEAEALADRVRAQCERTPYPGIQAALIRVQAKVLIQRGLWSLLNIRSQGLAKATTKDGSERLHAPLLLAQLSIAAVYSGDLPTAREDFEACRRLLPDRDPDAWAGRHAPELLWARLLLEEGDGGWRPVVHRLGRLARDPGAPLVRLFAAVPGSAAWAARLALGAGKQSLARYIEGVAEDLRASRPSRAALSAEHTRGVLESDAVALARVATRHWHAWARAQAASDLAQSLDVGAGAAPVRHGEPGRHVGERRVVAVLATSPARVLATEPVLPEPDPLDGQQAAGWGELSRREQEMARLAAAGLTNRQIASRVDRSVHTVNFHLRSVFRKLKITSRVEIGRHLPVPGGAMLYAAVRPLPRSSGMLAGSSSGE